MSLPTHGRVIEQVAHQLAGIDVTSMEVIERSGERTGFHRDCGAASIW
jgi:hypothetical protein